MAKHRGIILVMVLALVMRLLWLLVNVGRPWADDVIYAAMAESIRLGEDFPLVTWRLGYVGTLGNSWVLAALFRLTGPSLLVTLAYGVLLSLLQVWLWRCVAERLRPGAGVWAALLVAVQPPMFTQWAQALSYCEFLTVGALLSWMIIQVTEGQRLSHARAYLYWVLWLAMRCIPSPSRPSSSLDSWCLFDFASAVLGDGCWVGS